MIRQALDTLTPTLRDVTGWLDVSYETTRSYRIGRRAAPPDVGRRLAALLRVQARKLEGLADRLDREAGRDPS